MADGRFLGRPRDLAPFSGDLDQMFNRMMRSFAWPETPPSGEPRALRVFEHAPKVEVKESDKAYTVTAELPGLDEKDVEITVEEGVLTLRGEKKSEVEDKDRGYTERSYGRFERRVGLPKGVDRDKADANFKNGVLTVTLPKTEAANENIRRIPVNGRAA